jgi:3-hydroxyacyl-[acyl-carrier-protein] dehydratase
VSEPSLNPTDYLPHRPPFLLVDTLISVEPGVRATGTWHLTGQEYFFPGHFPGRPTTPGVLLMEALAQVGGVAVLADSRYTGRLPLFGGIESARFRRQVVPGDTVLLETTMTRLSARGGKGHGRATVNGELAAEGELFFILA